MEVIVWSDRIQLIKINGVVTSIQINHRGVWSEVPYNPETYSFDETHPLTQELREWEAVNGALDLGIPQPPPPPNWEGLTAALRGTPLFAKIYEESRLNQKVFLPFSLLLAVLTGTKPDFGDLEFALFDIKTQMGELLTPEDLQFANQTLADHFFAITL